MKITFDASKRARTLAERGLDFASASEVFSGRHMTVEDDRQDYGEKRYITVGFLSGRMVVLVWTLREGACRVISMRKANDREQEAYSDRLAGSG